MLPDELVERILSRLSLTHRPTLDLVGLNALYAAWCGNVPFDNVRKRIWFASDQTTPLPGQDPTEFFENWLTHGTSGTCWPTSGAMYALLNSLGFDARRIAGSMIDPGETDSMADGHGSVLATVDGVDYLVDASILAFEALPLVPGVRSSAGQGIHQIQAVPIADRFDVLWRSGLLRDAPVRFRTDPGYDPVDQAFFLEGYERSKRSGPFNDALYICRRFPDSILTVGRRNRIAVAADGTVTVNKLDDAQRRMVLIDEFGLSEEITRQLPADKAEGDAPG